MFSASAPISSPAARAPVATIAGSTRQRQRERVARGRAIGLVAGCPQQFGLAAHDAHQARAHLGRRLDLRDGERQRVGRSLQLSHFLAALRAGREMLAEGLDLMLVERAEDVGAGIGAALAAVLARAHESTCSPAGPS